MRLCRSGTPSSRKRAASSDRLSAIKVSLRVGASGVGLASAPERVEMVMTFGLPGPIPAPPSYHVGGGKCQEAGGKPASQRI